MRNGVARPALVTTARNTSILYPSPAADTTLVRTPNNPSPAAKTTRPTNEKAAA
jgi:hypothetical protein